MSMNNYLEWARKVSTVKDSPVILDRLLERAAQCSELTTSEYDTLCTLGYGEYGTFGIVRRLSLLHRNYEQAQQEATRLAVFLERPAQLGMLMASIDKHFQRGCPSGVPGPVGRVEWVKEKPDEETGDTEAWKSVENAFDALYNALTKHRSEKDTGYTSRVEEADEHGVDQWVREMTLDEAAVADAWARTETVLGDLRTALTELENTKR